MRRITILLAAAVALLLIPAAQAFAVTGEHLKINITNVGGEGSGAVCSGPNCAEVAGEPFWGTSPYIECEGPPAKAIGPGLCETKMKEAGPGFEQVFLLSEPAPGSKIVEWIVKNAEFEQCGTLEACMPYVEPSGTGTNNAEVTAVFACITPGTCSEPKTPTALTIAKEGGEGTIISSPKGIECTGAKTGAECQHNFEINEKVTLTASPAAGYAFSGWGGCNEQLGLTCKVTMEKAKTVKAKFIATPSLTIEKAGSGAGKLAATGISCDESCSKETAAVKTGTVVTVKAAAAKGSEAAVFEGGTGSAATGCSGATCSFTISEASSLKVKFVPISSKTLTVKLTGPGAYKGKVTGKGITVKGLLSTAIGCGSGCTTETESFFSTGETELVAAAGTGYKFAGWTVSGGSAGTCTGTTTPCKLLTDANKTVEAKFE